MKLEKNMQGNLVSETHRQCTNCKQIYKKTSKTVTLCPKCNCARVKSLSLETKMRNRAQQRARKSGVEFNLEKEDIIIPEKCPILGIPLISHKGSPGGKKASPSLDRKDPSKGYTKDNIWVISHLANQMKSHSTMEEMINFSKWVLKNYDFLDKSNELI